MLDGGFVWVAYMELWGTLVLSKPEVDGFCVVLNFLVEKVDLNFEVNVPIVDVDLLIRLIIFKDLDIFFDPLDFKASNNALNHPMFLCFLLAATTCG